MRIWKCFFAFILAMAYLPTVMADQSPEGYWTTIDDVTGKKRAVVHLFVQDGILGGTIEKVYPLPGDTGFCTNCPGEFKDKPTHGLKFVWGLKEKTPGSWDEGSILDGKTGKIYRVKMTVKGDKLFVRGYVGISMLGRTQIWVREKSPLAVN